MNGSTTIVKGDEGMVKRSQRNNTGALYYLVTIPRKKKEVWVHPSFLWTNISIRYENVILRSILANTKDIDTKLQSTNLAGQLAKAVDGQFQAWYANKDYLQLPENIEDRINTPEKRASQVQLIIDGCYNASCLSVLNRPEFTLRQLAENAQNARTFNASCVYGSRYSNFRDNPAKRAVARVGKSNNPVQRISDHIARCRSDSTFAAERTHYTQGRASRKQEFFVLCVLKDETDLKIAEQLFVNLLGTWAPAVRGSSSNISLDDEPRDTEGLMKHSLRAIDQRDAQRIMQVTHNISQKPESWWPGGVGRDSFGAS